MQLMTPCEQNQFNYTVKHSTYVKYQTDLPLGTFSPRGRLIASRNIIESPLIPPIPAVHTQSGVVDHRPQVYLSLHVPSYFGT